MTDYPLDHELGYAPVPRGARNFEPLMRDAVALQVWTWIYLHARHEGGWVQGSKGTEYLERGQVMLGLRDLAGQLRRGKNAIARVIEKLERLGLITRKSGQLGTIVTLVRYGDFPKRTASDRDSTGDSPGTDPGTAPGTAPGRTRGSKERVERENTPELPLGGVDPEEHPSQKKKTSRERAHPDRDRLLADFGERYAKRWGVYSPSGRDRGQASTLVRQHGLPECLVRVERLFGGALSWLTGPYDVGTLANNWNKLARAGGKTNGTPDPGIAAELERLERERRPRP